MSILWVWMNGERVATWTVTRGVHTLEYEQAWIESPRRRPLSLSLPFTADRTIKGDKVSSYFENLLPDDDRIRERVRGRFKAASIGAIDLLTAIGRDCVGAIQLMPPERPPEGFDRVEYEALDDTQVERHLILATMPQLAGAGDLDEDSWRISIAGAQEKTALLKIGDQWCRPQGATPTTHIMKLPLGLVANQQADMTHSVQNEWLCLNLLQELGLPAANSEILTFGSKTVLAVERFDREWSKTKAGTDWIIRLPQEDLCQALGLPPTQKYEHTDGKGRTTGPTMQSVMQVLSASAEASKDVATFLLAQMCFWILGNTDAHGKNFSIFLKSGDVYAMTPLYDVISLWPIAGDGPNQMKQKVMKLAIPLRARRTLRKLDDIGVEDWIVAANQAGIKDLAGQMFALAASVPDAVERLSKRLPAGFPQPIWDKVTSRVLERAKTFR
ncbi:type II toxin-antitoxin system HipA family toxin [Ramlibacter sp. PS3R-8]|uniref:type II toxin-antitoxin system HipA family toxin n=1 Tax=Ramlibacter sp. PS3R-8 TaxID=3133437 RepID=UPI0030A7028E